MTNFTIEAAKAMPGPDWLVKRRSDAAATFNALDPPNANDEQWRYSAIGEFDLAKFAPCDTPEAPAGAQPSGAGPAGVQPSGAQLSVLPGTAEVHTVNGQVTSLRLAEDLASKGIYVGPIANSTDAEEVLGDVEGEASSYFTYLNEAFATTPLLVRIPEGVVVEEPIIVTHHLEGEGAASFPRLVIEVGAMARAQVLEHHTSAQGSMLVCPLTEMSVAQGGWLGYLNIQQLGTQTWQFGSQLAKVGKDADLTAASAAFGGGYARTRSDVRLVGRGGNCDLLAMYFGDGKQGLDFRTYQDHVAPDTTSNLLYKGVVSQQSRSIYSGLIRVRPQARGTNAFQTNRNLKLGDEAWVESVPNLEIENNEVRCSHASAVGPVDAEQQFYLESRGVPTSKAQRLIVVGFLKEVLDLLPLKSANETLAAAIDAKLPSSNAEVA